MERALASAGSGEGGGQGFCAVAGWAPSAALRSGAVAAAAAAQITYLVTYMAGTVVAMASYTAFLGAGTEQMSARDPGMTRRISRLCSLLALVIGLLIELSAVAPQLVPFL